MAQTKTILITGATSGIGLATAERFAKAASKANAIHLILAGRRADRLTKICKRLSKKNILSAQPVCFDIRDRRSVDKFAREQSKILQNVDILLNNAGLAAGRDAFQNASVDDWEAMIDTNIKGLLYVTKRIVPHMIARKRGHIINIGSVAGHYTYPQGAVYCATKFAVRAINEGLRMDLLGSGVRVSSIDPGMVESEFSLVRFKGDEKAAKAVYNGMQPLTPEDIANTIFWVSEQPAHVNIQDIIIMPTDQASIRDIARK